MILHNIRVEGWTCLIEPVEVGPLTDGLNIIHGPNGTGKSSLMQAIARGLFDKHKTRGNEIEKLRAWGRDLSPKVTLEFEQDGVLHRLHKQFLDSQSAKIDRQENGKFIALAEGQKADDRAREILLGEVPGRGASDQRQWGLAQILWATQGNLAIDQLGTSTRSTIDSALGTQISEAGSNVLENRIAARYEQFFTGKSGKLRSGSKAPEIVGLQGKLEELRNRRDELCDALLEFEQASRNIEDLKQAAELAEKKEQQTSARLDMARQQVKAWNQLAGQRKQHQLERENADEKYRNLNHRIQSIESARTDQQKMAEQLDQLQRDQPVLEKMVKQLTEEANEAEIGLRHAREQRHQLASLRKLADLARRYRQDFDRCQELENRIAEAQQSAEKLAELESRLVGIIAPDRKQLEQIKKTEQQKDRLKVQLDAALVTVTLQLDNNQKLEVTRGQQTGSQNAEAGQPHQIKGSPDVELTIPGVGRIHATGPTHDYDELHAKWETANTQYEQWMREYQSQDVLELEARVSQADQLRNEIKALLTKQNTILGDHDLNDLRNEHNKLQSSLNIIKQEQPEWKSSPPDPDDLARQATDMESKIDNEIQQAETKYDQAQHALRTEITKQESQRTETRHLDTRQSEIVERLNRLLDDGMTIERLVEKRTETAMERDVAGKKLETVVEQMAEFGDDPTEELEKLERDVIGYREDASQAKQKLSTETGRLQQIISDAPYSALSQVEEEIASLEDDIQRQQQQLGAVRLLHHTVLEQKNEMVDSLVAPVRSRANAMLQRIMGARFEGIDFDESLLPAGIAPPRMGDSVGLDQISGGEQEQVHFAVRMALADIAFPTKGPRQMLVLDDVFAYTDESRLARIGKILAESTSRFQILLFTCHPERYRNLPGAKLFDLAALAAGG